MPQELSGGMRKRAGFAVGHESNIIFYDEPSAGLDPVSAGRIDRLILERAQSGTAQIVVTHEMGSAFELRTAWCCCTKVRWPKGTRRNSRILRIPGIRQFVEGGADGPLEESAS